jgi:hypothetical protein
MSVSYLVSITPLASGGANRLAVSATGANNSYLGIYGMAISDQMHQSEQLRLNYYMTIIDLHIDAAPCDRAVLVPDTKDRVRPF